MPRADLGVILSGRSRRALVAGASALLVATPVALQGIPPVPAAAAAPIIAPAPARPVTWLPAPALAYSPALEAREQLGGRPSRGVNRESRLTARRARAAAVAVRRAASRAPAHQARHAAPESRTVQHRTKRTTARRSSPALRSFGARRGLGAVVAFARAHVGASYRHGATGGGAYDCSGFTMRAYAAAGIRLPHQSGAQQSRGRTISRSAARPGDLVAGRGHVGIYMGHGMMIDAGNPRVGVVFRAMYSGLWLVRIA